MDWAASSLSARDLFWQKEQAPGVSYSLCSRKGQAAPIPLVWTGLTEHGVANTSMGRTSKGGGRGGARGVGGCNLQAICPSDQDRRAHGGPRAALSLNA